MFCNQRMINNPSLVVVMPVFNEAANIHSVIREWMSVLHTLDVNFEMIVLNDGSTDDTAKALNDLAAAYGARIRPVDKPNSGHGRTCRVGYDMALRAAAEWVFQIDSDGQCDPQFFPQFWERRMDYDCIFGDRTKRDDGFGRMLISFTCRMLLWICTGAYIPDPNVPYRLIRSSVLRAALARVPADFDLQNIALALALRKTAGLRWKHVPIHFRARQGGENSIHYRKIATMGLKMLGDLRSIQ